MAKTMKRELAAKLRAESEQTMDDAYPTEGRPTRPNRSNVYSVRLSSDERARVDQVANAKHLPASTLVRSWILERLDKERIA